MVSSKHEGLPRWQAMPPTCSTLARSVSPSQSICRDLIFWKWPDSSPFFHIFCLLLDQKWVYPVFSMRSTASWLAQATIRTSFVIQS